MPTIIEARWQIRGGTAAQWTANNEVLGKNEMGVESDTGLVDGRRKYKIGDGVTPWNSLPYYNGAPIQNGSIWAEFDGSGSVLVPAQSRPITVPYAFRIVRWRLATGGEDGSVGVDVLKAPTLGAMPVSIVGSPPPRLLSAAYASGTDFTGWTTTGAAGNAIVFAISGINTITGLRVELEVQKT